MAKKSRYFVSGSNCSPAILGRFYWKPSYLTLRNSSTSGGNSMGGRGYVRPVYEVRPIQSPGMMHPGLYPMRGPADHRHVEHPPSSELLENKMTVQGAELERLLEENERLAATHAVMRQELVATQQEIHRIQTHARNVRAESDINMRGLADRIAKSESEINAGELLKKELQQLHSEARNLISLRQELASEIQLTTEELQKAHSDLKKLPEMHAELEALRREHQKLRAAFEYEKGSNLEQVAHMQVMENNLISQAREVEKLRAEVLNAEKRANVANPYGAQYGSTDGMKHQQASQRSNYVDCSYNTNAVYTDANYSRAPAQGHGSVPNENYGRLPVRDSVDQYGSPLVQMATGTAPEGMKASSAVGATGYSDGHSKAAAPATGGAPAAEGMNPYSSAATVAPYDAPKKPPVSANQ